MTADPRTPPTPALPHKGGGGIKSDVPFLVGLGLLGGVYALLIVAMLVADASFTSPGELWKALDTREIRHSIKLSLVTSAAAALLSVLAAVPIGYLMSRHRFPGKLLVDALLDSPIVLPPMVIGISLLILFQTPAGKAIERVVPMTYAVPGVVLAQFTVACAFAVRTMRVTFDRISPRAEQVALTLGCTRRQAFLRVVLPEARHGMFAAGTLAWARALGEFGPILIFAGATPMHTEVLSTSIFLQFNTGNIEAAIAVSLLMIAVSAVVLIVARAYGGETPAEM